MKTKTVVTNIQEEFLYQLTSQMRYAVGEAGINLDLKVARNVNMRGFDLELTFKLSIPDFTVRDGEEIVIGRLAGAVADFASSVKAMKVEVR